MDLSNHNPVSLAGLLKLLGLTDILSASAQQLSGCGTPCTSNNTRNPDVSTSVYAHIPGDAPWDITEQKLRAAMYFPSSFTHGKKMPVLMVPGTGNYGQQSFISNFGKKFTESQEFDPVYLNVEHYLMDDIQETAEYIAYALKYLHIMTNSTVAAVTWSQGMNIFTQFMTRWYIDNTSRWHCCGMVITILAVAPQLHYRCHQPLRQLQRHGISISHFSIGSLR